MTSTARAAEALAGSERRANTAPVWLSWVVWGVAAVFYLAGFYLRVAPAVMTTELMRDFRIGASQLGNFSAVYFYAYILMQIPTGVLVDTWGARRLLILGSLLAAAGTVLFGMTGSFVVASVGRAIVGGATAVGWIVTLKLATHWFPARKFAMLSGVGLLMGNIGALIAQVPLRLLVEHFGWRAVAIGSGACVLAIGAAAWAFVANDPVEKHFTTYAPESLQKSDHLTVWQLLRGFRNVFAYRNTWLIFFAQGGFVGAILAFTGLWGPSYLKQRFFVPATTASAICSVMIVCWAVASPLSGYLSDRIGRRKPLYLGGAIAAAIGWSILFYAPGLSLAVFTAVAALTSLACGVVVLGFAYGKESVPVRFLGTISGAINVGNMLGPTLLQPAIGVVLDRQWSGALAGGLRVYSAGAFQAGFLLIVSWAFLSAILIAFTRETHCRQSA